MNRNFKIYLLVIIAVLIMMGSTTSFAYFAIYVTGNGKTDVNIKSADRAELVYKKGEDISLVINESNFSVGHGNLSGTTTSTVTLTNSSAITEFYNVYFNININEYLYTTGTSKPELLLIVTAPDGTVIDEINGLTYTTIDGVSGFDITTETGLVTVAEDYEITTSSETVHEWIFNVVFINLDTDQSANAGKLFEADAILQSEEYILGNG